MAYLHKSECQCRYCLWPDAREGSKSHGLGVKQQVGMVKEHHIEALKMENAQLHEEYQAMGFVE